MQKYHHISKILDLDKSDRKEQQHKSSHTTDSANDNYKESKGKQKECREQKENRNLEEEKDLQDKTHVARAYETVNQPISSAIEKTISEGLSWSELQTKLKWMFEEVTDQHHGISLLTQCKQRRHETVSTYRNR